MNHRVCLTKNPSLNLMKVSQLLLNNLKHWNKEVVISIFNHQDAQAILEILLTQRNLNDFICWSFNSEGCYTVKNRYQCMWKEKIQSQNNTRDEASLYNTLSTHKKLWKTIWKLNIPPRSQFFSQGWQKIF